VSTRTFIIDEAWGSANYFSEQLRHCTAMNVSPLVERYPDLCVVATHSAHKSLSCLRQASMIHVRGPAEVADRLRVARFRLHTTSPNYPILASLDLGRAQMEDVGLRLVRTATANAGRLMDAVARDPGLSHYRVNAFTPPSTPFAYAVTDPTKVSLDVSELGTSASEIRELLYSRHGIYINRVTETSLLLNFHIGVGRAHLVELLSALRDIQAELVPEWLSASTSGAFIIPYPPGVPLAVPGEEITPGMRSAICDVRRSGVRVFAA
jgi:arginine/lysine/ornithine decarboxylase